MSSAPHLKRPKPSWPAMNWLRSEYDEGPFYQMQRIDRYRSVIAEMLADGRAYYC